MPAQQSEPIEGFLRAQLVTTQPERPLKLGLIDAEDEWGIVSTVVAEAELFVAGDQGILACVNPPLPLLTPRDRRQGLRGNAQARRTSDPRVVLSES
ncbi:MAG: hypothetical protein ACKOPS_02515, partial [Cyanobium sp.]